MPIVLVDEEAARLRDEPFTYDGVGGTLTGTTAPGYRTLTRSRTLHRIGFAPAVERLMTWQVHERAGLRVAASGSAAQDEVVLMRLGLGAASIRIPCRVVYVVNEPDAAGFAYGTLPGHPESGEEAFLLKRSEGGVVFTISAFSRPASRLARFAGPVATQFQSLMTSRYLAAADQV